MFNKFFQNTRKPIGYGGSLMVNMMNIGHKSLSKWGHSHISPGLDANVLDIGCGGGANLLLFLKRCPKGKVCGIDYSPVSVKHSQKKNRRYIEEGRCEVKLGDVSKLPYGDNIFDFATAFETIYFWPSLEEAFRQVYRVLKSGGYFMICNEISDSENDQWSQRINGMHVYSADTLYPLLQRIGFVNLKKDIIKNGKGMCIIAQKS